VAHSIDPLPLSAEFVAERLRTVGDIKQSYFLAGSLFSVRQSSIYWRISEECCSARYWETRRSDQMATVEEIGQEKQRISERLSRLDAERTKLAEQLNELEIAERVLARFGGGGDTAERRRRGRPARIVPQTGGQRRARGAQQQAASVSLSDATLQAVRAHPEGATANEILNHLSREFGMSVRPNHLGIALQRHRRAGRLENRDQRWHLPQSAQREQSEHAAMTG
jgi:hypothetical protein